MQNAATSGSLETIQAVLRYKPDLEARDSLGWTALIIAGEISLKSHSRMRTADPGLGPTTAASSGNTEVCSELIGAGASVSASNDREQTALHYAARFVVMRGTPLNLAS